VLINLTNQLCCMNLFPRPLSIPLLLDPNQLESEEYIGAISPALLHGRHRAPAPYEPSPRSKLYLPSRAFTYSGIGSRNCMTNSQIETHQIAILPEADRKLFDGRAPNLKRADRLVKRFCILWGE
jgi:hypothetical protein